MIPPAWAAALAPVAAAVAAVEARVAAARAQGVPVAPAAPREAEGSIPRLPVSMAATSDSMSPKRLSVTITSNRDGFTDMWIVAASMCM